MKRPDVIAEPVWDRIVARKDRSPVIQALLSALEHERTHHAAVVATWEKSHRQASADAGRERLAKEAALAEIRVLTERIEKNLKQALEVETNGFAIGSASFGGEAVAQMSVDGGNTWVTVESLAVAPVGALIRLTAKP